ncbi:MAG: 3-carboxy-cis,cis-muconate cycloisomerase [Ardenticatenaceae bacterium]|nr:3-carboxy-cis,cis-muconate cycloisomerase [Ardenticatenaceae bacterium]
MGFLPFDSQIFRPLFGDDELEAIFSDQATVRQWVQIEAALAQVQGKLAVIPAEAAENIVLAADRFQVDWTQLQVGVDQAGMPIVNLVRQLRDFVGPEAAPFVHWGATTQDIMDTAVVLQLLAALEVLEQRLTTVVRALAHHAHTQRHTMMAGRTHAQHALPTTFGLKAAGWLAPLLRHLTRLPAIRQRLAQLQLGGAAGTLASLGEHGQAVQEALAAELGLAVPAIPWHTQRDNLAEAAGWLSLVTGSLGKIGQDLVLLAQSEVAEVRESADTARGGSSTMPQKQNPVMSELLITAARTNASLLSNMHHALIQEHERGTHSWQMEWLTLPQMVILTGAALNKALFLSQNLVVQADQMQQTIARSKGLLLAEALNFALAEFIDRSAAKALIKESVIEALASNRHLIDVLQNKTDAPLPWDKLRDERRYLGSADRFIDLVLSEARDFLE